MTLGTRDHLRRGPCPAHRVRERPRDRPAATLGRGLWRARAPWGRSRRLQHSAARCGRRCAVAVHSRLPGNPSGSADARWHGRSRLVPPRQQPRRSNRPRSLPTRASRAGDGPGLGAGRKPTPAMDGYGAGRERGRGAAARRRRARVGGRVLLRGRVAARPLADDRALVALVVARHDQPALSAPPPTSCRGRPRFPSRRDCAWTRCAASASPSVKTPPCVPSDSAGRLHQCEPSLNCSVRSAAPAVGCSGGTNSIHDFMRRCGRRGRCPHRLPERQRQKLRPRTSVLANVG